MHARLARYTFSGDAHAIARKAEDGALPILRSMPGFRAYSVIESEDELLAFSGWDTAEQAEAASIAIADWVAENLADDVELIESRYGEILVSTTLAISTTARARV